METFRDTDWEGLDQLVIAIERFGSFFPRNVRTQIRRTWTVTDISKMYHAMAYEKEKPIPGVEPWSQIIVTEGELTVLSFKPMIQITRVVSKHNFIPTYGIQMILPLDCEGARVHQVFDYTTTNGVYTRIMNMIVKDPKVSPFYGSIVMPVSSYKRDYHNEITLNPNAMLKHTLIVTDRDNRAWLDVDFRSEEAARRFNLRDSFSNFVGQEVFDGTDYTIQEYWMQTRRRVPNML